MVKIPKLYKEDQNHNMPKRTLKSLSDRAYADAIAAMIVVCTDAAIIDKSKKTIFLAKRIAKPMAGWWFIGGRRIAGETPQESMRRCFKRETSLDLPENRFKFIIINDYLWKDRQQEPQNTGTHVIAYTFSVELTAEEQAAAVACLEHREYEKSAGLREFGRKKTCFRKGAPGNYRRLR